MNVFEEKINACMEWILAGSEEKRNEIAEKMALLQQNTEAEVTLMLEDCVADLLKELGGSPALLGFDYLVCAIALTAEDSEYLRQITKRLYPEVGKRFDTTASRVERAMRHAVVRTFDCGGYDELESLFGSSISVESGKVTNSEFIAGCTREVRRRMSGSSVRKGTDDGKL